MRQNFRIKTDLSKIYQDERKFSWIYVDHTKIFYVNHLIEHIRKLFDIKTPFHLLSKYDETLYFLPYEEDVRVLENNDTVLIVPRSGEVNQFQTANQVDVSEIQNGFIEPSKISKKNNNPLSERSSVITDESFDNSDAVSISDSFYRTALHETVVNNTEDTKINEDLTDGNSIIENSTVSTKRKRVRKKKQKKDTEVAEIDTSGIELSSKKPKVVDSVLISSGKHIRFQGIDNEEQNSDHNVCNGTNSYQIRQNNDVNNKQIIHKDLAALLSLRQSSTPLTFSHKRVKREFIPESINETGMDVDTSNVSTVNDTNQKVPMNKSANEAVKSKVNSVKETSQVKESFTNNDTVSFKVFKIGEDYTPQVSNVILAKVLNHDKEASQYTLQILHGKEQLQEPDGKFALPKEDGEYSIEDIITLEESKLLELTSVKPV